MAFSPAHLSRGDLWPKSSAAQERGGFAAAWFIIRGTRIRREAMAEQEYVVVGGGTAGCVVAARLAERGARVLLLEAGPSDRHWTIRIPSAIGRNYEGGPFNW